MNHAQLSNLADAFVKRLRVNSIAIEHIHPFTLVVTANKSGQEFKFSANTIAPAGLVEFEFYAQAARDLLTLAKMVRLRANPTPPTLSQKEGPLDDPRE